MTVSAPTHVMHVIKGLGRGGAEMLLAHASRYVDRRRYRLSFAYFLEHKDALVDSLKASGAPVTLLPAKSSLGVVTSAARLARVARDQSVDLIHAHLPISAVAARLAGRRTGLPVVYTEHNLHERHHVLSRWANRATWRLQRHVVAVSEAVEESILRGLGRAVPVSVVRNAVPVEDLARRPDAGLRFREQLGIDVDLPVVGQIAVFRPEKRLDRWLEAAVELRQRVPECHFVLVGDGPERPALEAHAAARSLGSALHFAGLREDVRAALSAFDVLMISSRFEGLPLVLLEAMAASTPVVATAVGGVPEVVIDGETGLLLEDADAAALAGAVAGLLTDPERRHRLARAAAAHVTDHFSAEAAQRQLEKLYDEVLGR